MKYRFHEGFQNRQEFILKPELSYTLNTFLLEVYTPGGHRGVKSFSF